jgi:hypothetical protein
LAKPGGCIWGNSTLVVSQLHLIHLGPMTAGFKEESYSSAMTGFFTLCKLWTTMQQCTGHVDVIL